MNNSGYINISSYVPQVKVGDVDYNIRQIRDAALELEKSGIKCVVFPELSVTGYTCGDLFEQSLLMQKAEEGVRSLAESLKDSDIMVAVGVPVAVDVKRYNCAVIICRGRVLGIVPKIHIPNYAEFYEKRWFASGLGIKAMEINYAGATTYFGTNLIFEHLGVKFGIEICEDLWVPEPPSGKLCQGGAEIILNLSASDELIGKHDYLVSLISQQSARCRCVYVYSSAGWGESSTDLVFSGKALIGYDGSVYGPEHRFAAGPMWESLGVDIEKLRLDRLKFNSFAETENTRSFVIVKSGVEVGKVDDDLTMSIPLSRHPFVPQAKDKLEARCEEISNIQAYGLMRRLDAIKCRKAVVGISGGLDSTLALLVTVKAFDKLNIPRNGIVAVTMPGEATSSRTHSNATALMEALGVSVLEIPIGKAVSQHFADINQDPLNYDATYENSQARERTQILMDLANKEAGIVIGTGDMSELALGWCTYNGDHMSMYGVNASVPKTLVKYLVEWYATKYDEPVASILKDIIDTPISPELVPSQSDEEIGQKTEDLVGPYELHDFFLYHLLRNSFSPKKIFNLAVRAFEPRYDKATILKWLKIFIRRFFSQQFKRSCMPDGPKVGSVNLSPRGDWRMPSDACADMWLKEVDEIEI